MFKLKFLPATIGDAIWITYGDLNNLRHVLIDGGTKGTRLHIQQELEEARGAHRKVDLAVVSHIDKDHIGGILTLLQNQEVEFQVEDFWFNALRHLPTDEDSSLLSVDEGEQLTTELDEQRIAWNAAFGPSGKRAVVVPDVGELPTKTLTGGMKLTLLSPTKAALADLREVWEEEIAEAGIAAGATIVDEESPDDEDDDLLSAVELPDIEALAATRFQDDTSEANGSSIALLAEFEGKRALLAADAHVGKLLHSLERLSPGRRLKLDLFKISHHGSRTTTSRELIAKVDCPRYVFSTNGSIFKHPHQETVARVIVAGGDQPQLFFNYKSQRNAIWDREDLKDEHGYTATYPSGSEPGIEISL